MTRRTWRNVCRVAALALPVTALWLLLPAVPFVWTSYVAWAALILLPFALLAILRPLPSLWLSTRRTAAFTLAGAAVAICTALLWPVQEERVAAPASLLDRYLPRYQFRERHETCVAAAPAQVWAALRATPMSDLPAVAVLARIRSAAFGRLTPQAQLPRSPMLAVILQPGSTFFELVEKPGEEIVIGMAGQPWRNAARRLSGPAEFLSWNEPDSARMAFNFRVEPEGAGSRIITETRIEGTDEQGSRHFARYWRLVYPGSAIIRHQMLQAVAQRAGV